jgi:hypothetical protein
MKNKPTAIFFGPRHDLNDEQAVLMRAQDPKRESRVWRSREVKDFDGAPMCGRQDEAKEVRTQGLNVEHILCENDKDRCALFDSCRYQAQKLGVKNVSYWWFTLQKGFGRKPKFLKNVKMMAIDENMVRAAIRGPETLSIKALLEPVKALDAKETAELTEGRDRLYEVLKSLPAGPVDIKRLLEFGRRLTALSDGRWWFHLDTYAGRMAMLERKLYKQPAVKPTTTDTKKLLAVTREHNITVQRLEWLWELIRDGAKPIDEREQRVNPYGRIVLRGNLIEMVGLHKLWFTPPPITSWKQVEENPRWRGPAVVVGDALYDPEIVRLIVPEPLRHEVGYSGREPKAVRSPHVTQYQLVDQRVSMSMIAPKWPEALKQRATARDKALHAQQLKECERRVNRAVEFYAVAVNKWIEHGCPPKVLLITYRATEEALFGCPEKTIAPRVVRPPWLHTLHFGGLTGFDIYRDVQMLCVLGRPLPPAWVVAMYVAALTGRVVESEYVEVPAQIWITPHVHGFGAVQVYMHKHLDPFAEKVRAMMCEGELLQAWGRARPGERTAETPLTTFMLSNQPVPQIGLVRPVHWDDLEPRTTQSLFAEHGVCFNNAQDAAALGFVSSANNLKKVWEREAELGDISLSDSLLNAYRELSPSSRGLVSIAYRRPGRGFETSRVIFMRDAVRPDGTVLDGEGDWLRSRLGKLAKFEIER